MINIENGSKRVIVESAMPEHSWSSDGKMLYYGRPTEWVKICVLNMETGETKKLFDGRYPEISKDGTKLAYFPQKGSKTVKVKDLLSNEEWDCIAPIREFCFSPNGEFLCTVEYASTPWLLYREVMKIWDYKTGVSQVVVPSIEKGVICDIDWAE